tara:strand:+ start:762 stop:1133 length:372 start_codon:yes stop_codon:yes gene_type:complete
MSQIIFKDQKGLELFNEVLKEDAINGQSRLFNRGIEFHNSCELCAVCFEAPTINEKTYERINLTKHHIKYFPQKIAFVHSKCHDKIHDPNNPITYLIDFQKGDSRKFYANQKISKLTLGSCAA